MTLAQNSTKKRDLGIDILRLFAIYAIIAQHSSAGLLISNAYNNGFSWWLQGLIYGSFFKWATAVFVMISGAYLLEEKKSENIWIFLKNRFKRIIIPFIAWAIIYKVMANPEALIESKGFIFKSYFIDIISGKVQYHLWFIYMLTVLYLITPLLSVFVNKAPPHVIYYLLGLWLVLNFIPAYLDRFAGMKFGLSPYLEYTKYSGFYILGYMLKDIKVKKPWILFMAFIFISLLNMIISYYLSVDKGANDYFILSRNSLTNLANAILLFLVFKSTNWKYIFPDNSKPARWITLISLISYGIYLNHVLILNIIRSGDYGFKIIAYHILGEFVHPKYGIPVVLLTTIIASTLLAWIFSKIPFIKKILV